MAVIAMDTGLIGSQVLEAEAELERATRRQVQAAELVDALTTAVQQGHTGAAGRLQAAAAAFRQADATVAQAAWLVREKRRELALLREQSRKRELDASLQRLATLRAQVIEATREACDFLGAWFAESRHARKLLSQGGDRQHEKALVLPATALICDSEVFAGDWIDRREVLPAEILRDSPPRLRPVRER